ncbi:MAG: hypothetical protein P4N59_03560 [Negativicutes bacterium]|nr:hypothetical protein [Negativicutes bacterium]
MKELYKRLFADAPENCRGCLFLIHAKAGEPLCVEIDCPNRPQEIGYNMFDESEVIL